MRLSKMKASTVHSWVIFLALHIMTVECATAQEISAHWNKSTTEPSTILATTTSISTVHVTTTASSSLFEPITFTTQTITTGASFSLQDTTTESTRLLTKTTLTIEASAATTLPKVTIEPSPSFKTTITQDISSIATTLNEFISSFITEPPKMSSTSTSLETTTTTTTLNELINISIIEKSKMLSTSMISSRESTIEPTPSSLTTQTMPTEHNMTFTSQDTTTEYVTQRQTFTTHETTAKANTSPETTKPTTSIETSTLPKTDSTTALPSQEITEPETTLETNTITTKRIVSEFISQESTTESATLYEPTTLRIHDTTTEAATTKTSQEITTTSPQPQPPPVTQSSLALSTSTTLSSPPSTTFIPSLETTTNCPVFNFTRPGVGLNEECGENSISGICTVSKSVCTETHNSTIWLCMCSYGYIQNNQDASCMKAPDDLFTQKSAIRYIYQDGFTASYDLDKIRQINITNSTAVILGENSNCNATIDTSQFPWLTTHALTISCTLPQSKWYRTIHVPVFVAVFIEDITISDYFNFTIKRFNPNLIWTDVIIMDGTPNNSVVGQIKQFINFEQNGFIGNSSLIYIDEFGTIRTKKFINLDDHQNNTILYHRETYWFDINYHSHVLFVYIARQHFYREPLPEDSPNTTVIGIVDVGPYFPYVFVNVSSFTFDNYLLLLGHTKLNYTERTEIIENIVIRLYQTEFNVSIIFKIIDINNNAPYFLHEPYTFTTTQSAFSGVVVGAVEARDIDTNSVLHFTISPQDEITITDSGLLTLKRSISYSNYYVDVSVSDGKYTTTTKIHIKSELKQNASLGYTFPGTVKENINNSFIAKIALAGYENFRFFEDDAYESFYLDKVTGVVYANDSLDPLKPIDSALITITILENENNYYPVFQQGQYTFPIRWNHRVGRIGDVIATDKDGGKEGKISYSIIGGNTRGYFDINQTGSISLIYQLDSSLGANNTQIILLTVQAKDHGFIPKSNTTKVTIRITGENPGACIQGTAHKKEVQRLTEERQNWSYALYGLSGALCITIITTILFLFKWKSSPNISQKQQDKYRKGNTTSYQDLDETSRRTNTPYSVSNQQLPIDGFKNRWGDQENPSLHRNFIQLPDDDLRNRWDTRDQNDELRFNLERDDEPMPDYMDPIPDYE